MDPLSASQVPPVGIGRHYARYSGATVMIMLAGLVSFPALTRLLDNQQYGILGYFDTWAMMAVAVIKFGAQHAILRLYPFGGDQRALTRFSTNLVYLPMIVSMVIWTVAILGFGTVSWLSDTRFPAVLWCAIVTIPLLAFSSQVEMTLRVSERSGLLTATRVAARWLELGLVLTAVVVIQRSALAVYAGKILALLVVVGFYARWAHRNLRFSREAIDPKVYRAALRYSLPLVGMEIAGAALVSIDRIMLKHMLGDYTAVGIYTIGYALAIQLSMVVNNPFWDALNPVVNRTYTLEGDAKVRQLKARLLVPVGYACVGVAIGVWTSGSDVLQMLSGASKAASGPVFAWVGTMYALTTLLDLTGYGLTLRKRTGVMMALMLLALAVNVVLNLLWIPIYGYMGSVYATVLSYFALGVGRCVACPKGLLQLPDARTVLVAGGCAGLFLLVVYFANVAEGHSPWLRASHAGGLWLLCYVIPVLIADGRIREVLIRLLRKGKLIRERKG
ncbi:MAG: lipopolysaccharide biosynthesis protein [Lysobacter sp.]